MTRPESSNPEGRDAGPAREVHLGLVARNLAFVREADRLRNAMETQDVPMLFLKGAAFLDTLYPRLQRPAMADIDILVRGADRERAAHVLRRSGYRLAYPKNRVASRGVAYNWPFVRRGGTPCTVELHDSFCNRDRFSVDYEGVWRRAVRLRAAEREIPTLAPEDHVLHNALHFAKHAFGNEGARHEDLRRIVATWQPRWSVIIARAREWRMRVPLFVALERARQAGVPVPESVVASQLPSRARRAVLYLLSRSAGHADPMQRMAILRHALALLATVERPRDLGWSVAHWAGRRILDLADEWLASSDAGAVDGDGP